MFGLAAEHQPTEGQGRSGSFAAVRKDAITNAVMVWGGTRRPVEPKVGNGEAARAIFARLNVPSKRVPGHRKARRAAWNRPPPESRAAAGSSEGRAVVVGDRRG